MKLLKIVLVMVILAGLAPAEEKVPVRFVRVMGTAEVKVVPDRAVIEVGVEKQDHSASVAKHAEDAAARRILATLKAGGIDEKDIQTTYLSLQPQSSYVKKVRVSYFVAQQTMAVTVRDLSKLDGLLESLVKAGGNRIDSISYETSDLRKYRDQARDLAVKAAREKAEALAKAVGQDIGKAQTIEEPADSEYTPGIYANATRSLDAREKSASPILAAGQKTISASVTVSFELN
ncbi:MAG TPA: SIMPL domain-containing protein [Verrucomicrobiae bacterium]|nr:SIMPL domain-containing protein [Verrucomicrobiae bacterium]